MHAEWGGELMNNEIYTCYVVWWRVLVSYISCSEPLSHHCWGKNKNLCANFGNNKFGILRVSFEDVFSFRVAYKDNIVLLYLLLHTDETMLSVSAISSGIICM